MHNYYPDNAVPTFTGKPGTHTWHGSQSHGNAGPGAYPIAPLSNASSFGKPASFYLDWSGSVDAEWAWFPGSSQLEFVNTSLRFDTRRAGEESFVRNLLCIFVHACEKARMMRGSAFVLI